MSGEGLILSKYPKSFQIFPESLIKFTLTASRPILGQSSSTLKSKNVLRRVMSLRIRTQHYVSRRLARKPLHQAILVQ